MAKEKVICLPPSDLGYLCRLVQADVERLRESLRTGDYFDQRSQERLFKYVMGLYERLGDCEREITTVNPEDLRPKGKWIASKLGYLCCSECHDAYIDPEWIAGGKWKYCPNCGCRMEE